MISKNHKDIIRRVAIALIVVGILDTTYMLFWFAQGSRYMSGFNIFAMVSGIFLLKEEDFRVVEKVSVFSGFFFGSVLGLAIAIPFSHPLAYWQDKILNEPFWIVLGFIQVSFLLVFSFWVFFQLTSAPVKKRRQNLGLRRDRSMWGLFSGIILGIVSFVHTVFLST